MATNQLFLNQTLNEIMIKAMKYEELKNKQKEHNIKYEKRKREEKDTHFLDKKKQYAKNYYERNKEKVIQKQLQRYYNNKNSSSGEESE
jgi:hypothetical protein